MPQHIEAAKEVIAAQKKLQDAMFRLGRGMGKPLKLTTLETALDRSATESDPELAALRLVKELESAPAATAA